MVAPLKITKRDRTRLQLIEAGLALLSEKNMDGASIDEIATIAGVARGTFYNYFNTREELLIEISNYLRQSLIENLFQKIPQQYSIEQRISCIIYGVIYYATKFPQLGWAMVRIGGGAQWITSDSYTDSVRELKTWLEANNSPAPIHVVLHYLEATGLMTIRRILEGHLSTHEADALIMLTIKGIFGSQHSLDNLLAVARDFFNSLEEID